MQTAFKSHQFEEQRLSEPDLSEHQQNTSQAADFATDLHDMHEQLAACSSTLKSRNSWFSQSLGRKYLLVVALSRRPYFYLLMYIGLVIFSRLTYRGYNFHAIWSAHQDLTNYLALGLMLLFCCIGLQVAGGFLSLTTYRPAIKFIITAGSLIALTMLGWYFIIGDDKSVALVVFMCMSLFMLCMLVIGICKVRQGSTSERIFLAAALCGMVGASYSTFVLNGLFPFTSLTFTALELLAFLELSLLAFALGCQARQHQQACVRAERMASRDSLTDLFNRRAFLEMARPIWHTAQRNHRPMTMIMLDIDHFKQVNDQFGHEVGDNVLRQTAELLAKVCRAGDLLSRWGGEEFLLLLPETDLEQAHVFAERIRISLEALGLPTESDTVFLTASLGVTEGYRKKSLEAMMREADAQLYTAKRNGRNQTSCEKPQLTPVTLCE